MTENLNEPVTYSGGCHCGAVRFQVVVDNHKADDCNCSICAKKGFLHLIVPGDRFTLLQGDNMLTTYTFNTKVAQHKFCRICGIHAFYIPRSHPDCIDVNIRCLDAENSPGFRKPGENFRGDVLSRFEIVPFDGANWEKNIHKLRSD